MQTKHTTTYFLLTLLLLIQFSCKFEETRKPFNYGCYSEKDGKIFYKHSENNIKVLKGINPEKCKIIGTKTPSYSCANDDIWLKDSMHIYYKCTLLSGADIKTFQLLGLGFSKDKNQVFYKAKALKNADPTTFNTLSEFYAKDDKTVYFKDKVISRITDAKGFRMIDGLIARDSKKIYAIDKTSVKFLMTDAKANFKKLKISGVVSEKYYEVKHSLYFFDSKKERLILLKYANENEFSILEKEYYSADDKFVYYKGKMIPNAKSNEIALLGGEYSKDKKSVFHRNKKLNNVNINKFKLENGSELYDSSDSIHFFLEGKRVDKI